MEDLRKNKLNPQLPSQGWQQILTARQEMLDAYDRARQQAKAHKVQTYHGNVGEAASRTWLSGFLPKRYGVTSGYVVSSGQSSRDKVPHFDVIIYDQMESPILWIEANPDTSDQGRSRAIPVEYVRAVLEVKATFSAEAVTAAIEHLAELTPLMQSIDDPQERYKVHLPPSFRCGLLFFEMRKEVAYSQAALQAILAAIGLRGFFGGIILRGEGHNEPQTGRMSLLHSETPIDGTLKDRKTSLLNFGLGQSVQLTDKFHIGSMILWSVPGFAQFAFDLIAMMQGTYEPGRVSSFYGIGSSSLESIKDAEAPASPTDP
jgi:hypothetical protein